jgi:hypothetical protein
MNYDTENNEEVLETKVMDTVIDSGSGEYKILGTSSETEDDVDSAFDTMVKKINSDNDSLLSDRPITEDEAIDYISGENSSDTLLSELSNGSGISNEAVKQLLVVTNRKLKGESFNTYKELPEEIRNIIDDYIKSNSDLSISPINVINSIKRNVADSLLDEFISSIQIDRSKHDFVTDMEKIYNDINVDIANTASELIEERNKAYREAADTIEDENKKARLLSILDIIDNARDLTDLKEFSKRCKIKKIELEKPDRIYRAFLAKYKNSTNNIYDINLAKQALARHLPKDKYTEEDIDAFLISFCKQVNNYSVDSVTDHAYMYYVLYYCALLDADKTADKYIASIEEVINNLRIRNSNILNK